MPSFILTTIFLIALPASLFAASPLQREPTGEPLPTRKVRLALNWTVGAQFGGFYAAQRSGLFKKEGIELDIIPFETGIPGGPLGRAPQAEFSIHTGEQVILGNERGGRTIAIYAVYQSSPLCLMAHPSKNLKTLEQVLKSDLIFALDRYASYFSWLDRKYHLNEAHILPFGGGVERFVKDEKLAQECTVTQEPIFARKAGVKPKVFMISDSGFDPYYSVVTVQRDFLEQNRPLVTRMLKAIRHGWQAYLIDPKPTNEFLAKQRLSLPFELLQEGAKAQRKLIESPLTRKQGLGIMTETRWKNHMDHLAGMKLLRRALRPSQYFVQLQTQ